MDEYLRKLGTRIGTVRYQMGLSQEALADSADISRNSVYNLERGAHSPSLAALLGISRAFGMTLGELLSFDETEKAASGSPVGQMESLIGEMRMLPQAAQQHLADMLKWELEWEKSRLE